MMIFPNSRSLHTIYITQKMKSLALQMLIDKELLDADDPLCPMIEAFMNQSDMGGIWIRNRIRLVFT